MEVDKICLNLAANMCAGLFLLSENISLSL